MFVTKSKNTMSNSQFSKSVSNTNSLLTQLKTHWTKPLLSSNTLLKIVEIEYSIEDKLEFKASIYILESLSTIIF